MSLDNRNTSAQFKRAEQLKRWEESDMAKQASGIPKSPSLRRIQFTPGCIFLAACDAGDKDEVEYLLQDGADIDTANVDGLTALHQACIDDNLDMVEFLVQKGADVNRKDNEGWTPLHATASCGFLSIARYLIENGADLAAINSDGELPVDLANSDAMEDLIQHHNEQQGIDCDEARQAEERIMLSDATKWLRTDSSDCDRPDPKTGATAMHVAAAKGYNRVLKLLLEGRGDIDRQDVDGWTPLHAAVYWGQKEATQMLLDAGADIDIQNYSGQLASDNAPKDILVLLDKARKNQARRTKRRPPSLGNRITDGFENSTETPTKVIRVEMKPIDNNKEKEVSEKENQPTEPDVILRRTQSFENDEKFYQKYAELRARIQANSCTPHALLPPSTLISNTKTSTTSTNNNNSSNNNNNNNNNNINTTTTGSTSPASNISSYLVQRSASLKDHRTLRKTTSNLVLGSAATTATTTPASAVAPTTGTTANTTTTVPSAGSTVGQTAVSNTTATVSPPTSPSGTPTTTPTAGQIRRSFVPPTRDEESETQRKAHAKRVRETRRSTQGVTLDEIKSAEQLVKKKNNPSGTESETTATGVNVMNASTTNSTTIPSSTSSPSSLSCYTSSPSSLSSSMTSTASTTTTASINDRVPAVKNACNNNNNDSSNNGEQEVPCGDELKNGDEPPVVVSASFTLPAPSAVTSSIEQGEGDGGGGGEDGGGGRRPCRSLRESDNEIERKNDKEESDEKEDVTVSYTISAPALRSSASSAPLPPPSSTGPRSRLSSNEAADQRGETVTPSVTATFHVSPPTTGTTTATSRPISATGSSSTTGVSSGASIAEHPSVGSISASATIRTTVGNGPGGAVSNSNNSNITNTSTTTNNTNAITTAGGGGPITTTSSSTYTKRSLFDIDNANSLTLAEKLRHEANKYAIAADADSELGPLGEDSTATSRAVRPATVTNTNEANPADSDSNSGSNAAANAPTDNSASVAVAAPLSPSLRKDAATVSGSAAERRPSWRLKVDGGSKFKLEDASTPNVNASTTQSAISGSSHESTTATPGEGAEHGSITTKLTSTSALAQRRLQQQQQQQNGDSTTSNARPVSASVGSSSSTVPSLAAAGEQYNRVPGTTAASTEPVSTDASLLNLRRPPRSATASGGSVAGEENKENDKENDSRTAQATQAVIQRRRRQKRRSTGVVPVGMEDLDPDRQDSPVDGEEKETGSERGRSRVGSTASELDTASQQEGSRENGGDFIDYKALYEQEKAEKEKLKASLRKKDEEVVTLKAALDRFTTATTKNNSLSELEKRERRAMERKMSEMEEELKLLQKYKTENERLRAENRALTRVVSKLTTSAQNQMQTNKQ
ncbi:protein phosphatase 1 regulatory subunit 12B-like isoform X8 [Anopheles albimanus]|uniref:protein phosphatase 1 regulatory subunit 12B-like isoform X8 n=1 Tax=Anopheles albimanus TaxID=7167 RepID=UPI00163E1CB5|nr:protein phosphatase 1 regulatory subunit 12B-like isoform X8 [Anopheles albimanus]